MTSDRPEGEDHPKARPDQTEGLLDGGQWRPSIGEIADVGVPDVPEFLEQIVASGGHLWACRMSADMMHLTRDDLDEEVEGIISAADVIDETDGAQLLFI